MTENEIIDLILKHLFDRAARPCIYLKTSILKPKNIDLDKNYLARIVLKMTSEKLILDNSEKGNIAGDFCLKIDSVGLDIISTYGSYSSFLHLKMTDKEMILLTLDKLKQFNGFVPIETIFNEFGRTDDIEQQHFLNILIEKKLVTRSNYSDWQVQITELGRRLNDSTYDSLFLEKAHINFIHNETIIGDKVSNSTLRDFKPTNHYKETESKQSKWKKFIYDPYTVGIGTGLILLAFTIYFTSKSSSNQDISNFNKPLFELQNYKIRFDNEKPYPPIDTLTIKIRYNGAKIIVDKNFKLLNYKFTDNQYFYRDLNFPSDPKLELVEVFLRDRIIDSSNGSETVLIQLKRQMIFNGTAVAFFNKEDKKIIGNLSIGFSYSYQGNIIQDSLSANIYVVKGYETDNKEMGQTDF